MTYYYFPLDPECPDVVEYNKLGDDPIMAMSGCWGEFYDDFAKKHRLKCEKCQSYGAANLDIA